MTALAAYEAGLRLGAGCSVRGCGAPRPLPLARWLGPADAADEPLLERCAGPTLDVGCGPGRLVGALDRRGVPALGIDVSAEAVRIGTAQGVRLVRRDVLGDTLGPVPRAGHWQHVILADGNVGIGGDVDALLRRCALLLRRGGTLIAEVEPPGTGSGSRVVEVTGPGGRRGSIRWARLGIDAVPRVAAAAGLVVRERHSASDRHVVVLAAAP